MVGHGNGPAGFEAERRGIPRPPTPSLAFGRRVRDVAQGAALPGGAPFVRELLTRLRADVDARISSTLGRRRVEASRAADGWLLTEQLGERQRAEFPRAVLLHVDLRDHEGVSHLIAADDGVQTDPIQHNARGRPAHTKGNGS